MSNRILGILLIIGVTGFGYLFYLIFFVSYTGTLYITSNVDNYSVKMFAKKIAQTYNYECKTKTCSLTDISPFDYNVTISSPTYKDYTTKLVIKGKEVNNLKINLIKDTKLSFIEEKAGELVDEVSRKVDELKLKKGTVYFTYLDTAGYLYFKENGSKLDFFRNYLGKESKIGTFGKVTSENIKTFQIYGNDNEIGFRLGDETYIYNLATAKIIHFKLVPKIKYIKLGEQLNSYLIVTDIGVFTYDYKSNTPKYFYLFKDFVYNEGNYIGVIYKDETDKFNNFSLKNNSKNVIIKYNSTDLKRNVILETDLDVEKIIYLSNEIYFFDRSGKKYRLENY